MGLAESLLSAMAKTTSAADAHNTIASEVTSHVKAGMKANGKFTGDGGTIVESTWSVAELSISGGALLMAAGGGYASWIGEIQLEIEKAIFKSADDGGSVTTDLPPKNPSVPISSSFTESPDAGVQQAEVAGAIDAGINAGSLPGIYPAIHSSGEEGVVEFLGLTI